MTDLDDSRTSAAAELLVAARRSDGISDLPVSCRPRSEAEAYAIQDAVAARCGPIVGWKVGAASPAAPPNCAALLAGTVLKSPALVESAVFTLRGVEAEIAFRLAHDLPPRPEAYPQDEVLAAIESACPAIELCESRYRDFTAVDSLSKLADNNTNGAVVLGSAWPGWPELAIADQPVRLAFGDEVVVEQLGGNTAGTLPRLLVWLANHLSDRGHGLRKGQVVMTGSWTGLRFAEAECRVTAGFPGIGEAVVTFD